MNITRLLRNDGYDLIDSPTRNHGPLQIWLKQGFDTIQPFSHLYHSFKSENGIAIESHPSLNINHTVRNEFKFNIGVTVLKGILDSLRIGNLELSGTITNGRSLSISYENAFTNLVPIDGLEAYLHHADFDHANPGLLRHANNNNLIVITGVVYARSIKSVIETTTAITAEMEATITDIIDGRLEVTFSSSNRIELSSSLDIPLPVAVKAHKLDFDKGEFNRARVITDNGNWF